MKSGAVYFVGLGAMGLPMATRLIEAGYEVIGKDANPVAEASLKSRGGITDRPDLHTDTVSAVVLMLPNGQVVEQAIFGGEPSLAGRLPANALLIDMSSSHPNDTRNTERSAAALGLHMIDAPVSGGIERAKNGNLAIMAGGSADHYSAAQPILKCMGNPTHVGPIGSGHAIKALNNLLSASGLAVAIEVLLVARKFGIEPESALKILNSSSGMNHATLNKISQYILSGSYASGFALDLQAKDLAIASDMASAASTPLAVSSAVVSLIARCKEALGPSRDHTEIAKILEQDANISLNDLPPS